MTQICRFAKDFQVNSVQAEQKTRSDSATAKK